MRTTGTTLHLQPGEMPSLEFHEQYGNYQVRLGDSVFMYVDGTFSTAGPSPAEQLDVLEAWSDELAAEIVRARASLLRSGADPLPGMDGERGELSAPAEAGS